MASFLILFKKPILVFPHRITPRLTNFLMFFSHVTYKHMHKCQTCYLGDHWIRYSQKVGRCTYEEFTLHAGFLQSSSQALNVLFFKPCCKQVASKLDCNAYKWPHRKKTCIMQRITNRILNELTLMVSHARQRHKSGTPLPWHAMWDWNWIFVERAGKQSCALHENANFINFPPF